MRYSCVERAGPTLCIRRRSLCASGLLCMHKNVRGARRMNVHARRTPEMRRARWTNARHTRGTRGAHAGHTRGTRGAHAGHTRGTRGAHAGHTRGTRGEHAGNTWGTRGAHAGHTRAHAGHTRGTRGAYAGHALCVRRLSSNAHQAHHERTPSVF